MDFAKNLLQKYGWKEGEGLGKNSDGISAPIKASMKFNSYGLGANRVNDVTNNWWERVYNEASNNLEVESDNNNALKTHINIRQEDAVEITTKSYSTNKLKQRALNGTKYGSTFLRASMLAEHGGEKELADRVIMDDIELKPTKTLTDEELFAACGGRTAHKGARHGLTLNGKLARIDEQNNKLLQELEHQKFETVIKSNDWQVQHSKNNRKRSKKQKRNDQRWFEKGSENTVDDEVKDMVHHADYVVAKNRKKKKEHQKNDQDLATCVASMFSVLPEEDGLEGDVQPAPEEKQKTKLKKKKQNASSKLLLSLDDELDQLSEKIRKLDHSSLTIKKKGKKKKTKLKQAITAGSDEDEAGDTAMLDPAAKYRKDYRPDLKRNNRLLKALVPHETPEEKRHTKPPRLLHSGSSAGSEDEEDVVQRVNAEQDRYWRKMRANVPKINIIEPTEDDCLALAQGLKERHQNEVKRVGTHRSSAKKKKSKKKQRQVAQLADSLSKKL